MNKKKHGISFEEAKTVFYDENARLIILKMKKDLSY
ncbi:BrnT family toxin [Leptospira interrogans]